MDIEGVVECVNTYALCFLKNDEVLFKEREIGEVFLEENISSILMNEEDLKGEDPQKVLDELFEYAPASTESDFHSRDDNTVILIVNADETTEFYYKSDLEGVAEELEDVLGTEINGETGVF